MMGKSQAKNNIKKTRNDEVSHLEAHEEMMTESKKINDGRRR